MLLPFLMLLAKLKYISAKSCSRLVILRTQNRTSNGRCQKVAVAQVTQSCRWLLKIDVNNVVVTRMSCKKRCLIQHLKTLYTLLTLYCSCAMWILKERWKEEKIKDKVLQELIYVSGWHEYIGYGLTFSLSFALFSFGYFLAVLPLFLLSIMPFSFQRR